MSISLLFPAAFVFSAGAIDGGSPCVFIAEDPGFDGKGGTYMWNLVIATCVDSVW